MAWLGIIIVIYMDMQDHTIHRVWIYFFLPPELESNPDYLASQAISLTTRPFLLGHYALFCYKLLRKCRTPSKNKRTSILSKKNKPVPGSEVVSYQQTSQFRAFFSVRLPCRAEGQFKVTSAPPPSNNEMLEVERPLTKLSCNCLVFPSCITDHDFANLYLDQYRYRGWY